MKANVETITNKKNERTINPISLLTRALLRWKFILACTLICCLLFISYKFIKSQNNNNSINPSSNNYYTSVVNGFDKALEDRYNYMAKTLVSNTNPYSQAVTETTYYVKSPHDSLITYVNNGSNSNSDADVVVVDYNAQTLLNTLKNFITYSMDWNDIKSKYSIDDDVFLNEMIVSEIKYGSINIMVNYENETDSQYIANYINNCIEKQFDVLIEKTGLNGYELIQVNHGTTNVIFGQNFNWLNNRINEINDIQNARDNFVKSYSGIEIVSENTNKTSIKDIIKYGIFGSMLGFMVSSLIVVLYLVISGKILSGNELVSYLDTKNILTLNKDYRGHKDSITKKIMSIEKENRNKLSDSDRIKLSNNTINQLVNKKEKIGIISDLPVNVVDKVYELLKQDKNCPNYTVLYDVVNNLEDREKLQKIDNVVLLVKDEKTKYENINELTSILDNYNTKLIGVIDC